MPPSYFPLRWEGTGDQWWYASPIDWAAANGHYDVVRELLHIDPNLLIKLTSLHRIRRLEMVWDDDAQFADVAKCRSLVARNLLHECELKKRKNSLICAGYGGWLLYTAASAGDMGFIRELIEKDPLLVFGEGEYGVTDIFYAAARSKNSEAFRLLFDYAISPRCSSGSGGQSEVKKIGVPSVYKSEMMNRAIHAAARGGNLEILKELLKGCSDILAYTDVQGSTVLHSASSKGRVEVVKDLVGSFDIITSVDNQGNTALHIAAYRGHLTVVEVLIHALPSSMSLKNYVGDTFLHMVVSGFRTPGFRRVDRQIELMKQLVGGEVVNLQHVINVRNNDGRTALHTAVIGNIHSNFVELLMSVPSIDLNIRDANNMTPLDLLRQHPQSASSEILMKQLISAGGISNSQDCVARSAIASHLKKRGTGSSPGTLFRISDAKIFLHTGIENASNASGERGSGRQSSCSSACKSELNHIETGNESHGFSRNKKPSSVSYAASRLKMLLGWPRRKDEKINCNSVDSCKVSGLNNSTGSQEKSNEQEDNPTPLRLRFSKTSTLPNNKRILAVRTSDPSPSSKKKFAAGLKHGVLQAMPNLAHTPNSPSTSRPRSPLFAPTPVDKKKGVVLDNEDCGPSCSKLFGNEGSPSSSPKSSSADMQLMNQYFCVGAQGLAADNPISGQPSNQSYRPAVLPVA